MGANIVCQNAFTVHMSGILFSDISSETRETPLAVANSQRKYLKIRASFSTQVCLCHLTESQTEDNCSGTISTRDNQRFACEE